MLFTIRENLSVDVRRMSTEINTGAEWIGDLMGGFIILIIILAIPIIYIEAQKEIGYDNTCTKCEILSIKSASAGGFATPSEYIYNTSCGTILTHERADIGDRICREYRG